MSKNPEDRIATLEGQVTELLGRLEVHDKAIKQLKRELRKLHHERDTIEGDVQRLKRDV
jgi:chromosome segregation ATPase